MTDPIRLVRRNVRFSDDRLTVRVDDIERKGAVGTYSVVERADSVTIVPVSELGRTVVLQQYRYPTQSFSWEIPMGSVDPGESARAAARRELREETGLRTRSLRQIGSYFAAPGLSPQRVSVFAARVDDQRLVEAESWSSLEDDICACRVVELDHLFVLARRGSISDGFTLAALTLLQIELDVSQGPLARPSPAAAARRTRGTSAGSTTESENRHDLA